MNAPFDTLIAEESGVCMLKTSLTSLSVQSQSDGTILVLAEDESATIRYFLDAGLARHLAAVLMHAAGKLAQEAA